MPPSSSSSSPKKPLSARSSPRKPTSKGSTSSSRKEVSIGRTHEAPGPMVGVAVFTRPENDQLRYWTLVIHPHSFEANDVRLYRVKDENDTRTPVIESGPLRTLAEGHLVGVIYCNRATKSQTEVEVILRKYLASGSKNWAMAWPPITGWVVSILEHLYQEHAIRLPCIPRRFYHDTLDAWSADFAASPTTAKRISVVSARLSPNVSPSRQPQF